MLYSVLITMVPQKNFSDENELVHHTRSYKGTLTDTMAAALAQAVILEFELEEENFGTLLEALGISPKGSAELAVGEIYQ